MRKVLLVLVVAMAVLCCMHVHNYLMFFTWAYSKDFPEFGLTICHNRGRVLCGLKVGIGIIH